jgi:hypothetical protein
VEETIGVRAGQIAAELRNTIGDGVRGLGARFLAVVRELPAGAVQRLRK